jgi:hypothetical protein
MHKGTIAGWLSGRRQERIEQLQIERFRLQGRLGISRFRDELIIHRIGLIKTQIRAMQREVKKERH